MALGENAHKPRMPLPVCPGKTTVMGHVFQKMKIPLKPAEIEKHLSKYGKDI